MGMRYKVIRDTTAYSKYGLSPTEKNGNNVGPVKAGFEFTPGMMQNGWLMIITGKWVKQSDCEALPETPPPDPNPPKVVVQWREGVKSNGIITWTKTRQFEETDVTNL